MRKCEVVHVDQGPIGCTLLHFAVPVLISQLLQEFYNIADCAVVGRFGGDYALAATGTAGLLLSVLINFFIGFSSGVSVETARLFGGKQYEPLKKTLQSIFRLAAGAGCLFTVFGLLLTDRILVALHCPPEIHGAASVYFRICLLGIAAQLIYNVGTAVLRSLGDTVSPMRLFGASALLNLVLDLLLVAGFSLGVAGAAWATLISQCFLGLAILWRFSKLEPEYRPVWTAPGLSAGELRRILQSGIPAGMQAIFMSISSLLVQISINSFGAAAVAGMTVYAKLEGFLYFPSFAYGIALTGFVGQNLGAGRFDRIRQAVNLSLRTVICFTLPFSFLLMAGSGAFLRIFTGDAAILQNAGEAVLYTFPLYVLYAMIQVWLGAVKGMGDTSYPMLCTMFCYCFFRVAWCRAVIPFFPSMKVVYLAYDLSWLLMIAMILPRYRSMLRHHLKQNVNSAHSEQPHAV